ncbi:MAG: hypothetical protein ACK4KW_15290, partial [Gemmobacter sp.]
MSAPVLPAAPPLPPAPLLKAPVAAGAAAPPPARAPPLSARTLSARESLPPSPRDAAARPAPLPLSARDFADKKLA